MVISTVGPWAHEKLERLRKYLDAYTTILSKQKFKGFYYIDAFAGPGLHEIRKAQKSQEDIDLLLQEISQYVRKQEDQREFLSGSPRIALNLPKPFTAYVFVEKSPDRLAELEKLRGEYADRKIVVRRGECNRYLLEKVANNREIDWKSNRAFVFLDPFGMQVQWRTIEALAATKAIEILLNFPVGMAIQRLLLKKGEFTTKQRQKLDNYFGTDSWYDALYKRESTLFDDDKVTKFTRSGEKLLNWYRERLKKNFTFVSKAALIRNSKKAHLYYLLLATHNKVGCNIANDIFVSQGEAV